MPEEEVVDQAKEDLREGKSPSTAAGEFVHEEIEHVREGKHGARSPQQAIAIGLSKARRAGIPLAPPKSRQDQKIDPRQRGTGLPQRTIRSKENLSETVTCQRAGTEEGAALDRRLIRLCQLMPRRLRRHDRKSE